jgi:hypothetical protein
MVIDDQDADGLGHRVASFELLAHLALPPEGSGG